ncbi:hypothetical protein MMPV_005768 [Pyropia vietnamensis]
MSYRAPTVIPMGDPDGDEPDSVFTHTERTFHAAVAAASRGLATSRGEADATERGRLLTAAAAEVAEAEECVASMRLDARSGGGGGGGGRGGGGLARRVDAAAADLLRLKGELRAARAAASEAAYASGREELVGGARGGSGRDDTSSMDDRSALLATTDILAASSARIADSRARMAETEAVGVGILADLASQRRTLGNARDNLTGVDDGLTQSRGLLATMSRTALVNRLALYAVGGITGLVLLFIVYMRLFGGRGDSPPPPSL